MPGPTKYDIDSLFEINKKHDKGKSFGISGKAYDKVYNETNPPIKGWTEPGMYNLASFTDMIIKNNKKMTFGQRLSCSGGSKDSRSPGPGSYQDHQIEAINKTGTYVNSNHKNSMARNFSKGERVSEFDKIK